MSYINAQVPMPASLHKAFGKSGLPQVLDGTNCTRVHATLRREADTGEKETRIYNNHLAQRQAIPNNIPVAFLNFLAGLAGLDRKTVKFDPETQEINGKDLLILLKNSNIYFADMNRQDSEFEPKYQSWFPRFVCVPGFGEVKISIYHDKKEGSKPESLSIFLSRDTNDSPSDQCTSFPVNIEPEEVTEWLDFIKSRTIGSYVSNLIREIERSKTPFTKGVEAEGRTEYQSQQTINCKPFGEVSLKLQVPTKMETKFLVNTPGVSYSIYHSDGTIITTDEISDTFKINDLINHLKEHSIPAAA